MSDDSFERSLTSSGTESYFNTGVYSPELNLTPNAADEAKVEKTLIPFFYRLEHISLSQDFNLLFQRHDCLQILQNFLDMVKVELSSIVAETDMCGLKRCMLEAFSHFHNHVNGPLPEEFMFDPANAWPMGVLFLLCRYLVKCRDGVVRVIFERTGSYNISEKQVKTEDPSMGYDYVRSRIIRIVGMGKGVFAALALSMAETVNELPRAAAEMYAAAFDVGMSHRQSLQRLPSAFRRLPFSLMVIGLRRITLLFFLNEVNKGSIFNFNTFPPQSHLEPTVIISDRVVVVTGHPCDVSRLKVVLKSFSIRTGTRAKTTDILEAGAQHHSTLNLAAYHDLLQRWHISGVKLSSSLLKRDVVSTVSREEWRDGHHDNSFANFQQEVAHSVTCTNQILSHFLDGDPLQYFAIGGHEVTFKNLLKWDQEPTRPHRKLLFTSRRSTTTQGVRRSLEHMGVINRIWHETHPNSNTLMLDLDSPLTCDDPTGDDDSAAFAQEIMKYVPVEASLLAHVTDVASLLELWDATDFSARPLNYQPPQRI